MSRSHHKTTDDRKGQDCTFPQKHTRPIEMFSDETYLYEAQDTGFTGITINVVKESSV